MEAGIEARVHPCMVPESAPIARVDRSPCEPATLQHRLDESAQRLRRDRVGEREALQIIERRRGHVVAWIDGVDPRKSSIKIAMCGAEGTGGPSCLTSMPSSNRGAASSRPVPGKARSASDATVSMTPSFASDLDVRLATPNFGTIVGDVGFGGIFYFLVDAQQIGLADVYWNIKKN